MNHKPSIFDHIKAKKLTDKSDIIGARHSKTGQHYLTDGCWLVNMVDALKLPHIIRFTFDKNPKGFGKVKLGELTPDKTHDYGPVVDSLIPELSKTEPLEYTGIMLPMSGGKKGITHRAVFYQPVSGEYLQFDADLLGTAWGLLGYEFEVYSNPEEPRKPALLVYKGKQVGLIMPLETKGELNQFLKDLKKYVKSEVAA